MTRSMGAARTPESKPSLGRPATHGGHLRAAPPTADRHRDTYTGALADLNLATSPWTGNRYTFTGGNPITGIETDGHGYCDLHACPGDPGYSYPTLPAPSGGGDTYHAPAPPPPDGGGGNIFTKAWGGVVDYGGGAVGGVVSLADSFVPGPDDFAGINNAFQPPGAPTISAPSYSKSYERVAGDLGVNTTSGTYTAGEFIGFPSLAAIAKTITKIATRAVARTAAKSLTALEQGAAKVPSEWGAGLANSKGVGTRWFDPANKGNGIRIDQGVPGSSFPSQQVDHVVVRSGGRIFGPDGKPIVGSLRDNPQAHIPLSDWLKWS